MFNTHEFDQWCHHLNLSQQTQTVIQHIRNSDPARRVQSRVGNVSGRYPSRKMGRTIQFESHRNELAAIHEYEHDENVREYYDQAPPIKLTYLAKNGRSLGVWHTADFFVIREDRAGWEECKTEEELLELVEKSPNRYLRVADGEWRCPPGERYAEPYGLYYRIRSSRAINWIYQRNILFLEDYLRVESPAIAEEARTWVTNLVGAEPGLTLADLLGLATAASPDDIYTLIATDAVYVDLCAAPLAEPQRVRVFLDAKTAQVHRPTQALSQAVSCHPAPVAIVVGNLLLWDGQPWEVINVGETNLWLRGNDGKILDLTRAAWEDLVKQGKLQGMRASAGLSGNPVVRELLNQANAQSLMEATRRRQIIDAYLRGELSPDPEIPERTLFRWLRQYREAETRYGNGFIGLIPRLYDRGNRTRRLPEETRTMMAEFIEGHYETLKQKNKRVVYGALLEACETRGLTPPSYQTFCKEIRQRPRYTQTLKRQGRRAAYQHQPFYFELTLTTPRHGDRPFEIGHIDHTQLDVELVCSTTQVNLGRPWATFLTDAFSRRILAVYLTFDPPSYRSCMMVLRECVRRHGRLPQIVVVDGGREFEGAYFETLLARYECTKKTRPPAQARFGSVCERLFRVSHTQFIHNLAGNTQITRNVRQVTKSVNPKNLAVWTLDRLYERLCEWAYEVYDTLPHPALGQSPRESFACGLAQSGHRPQRFVAYDAEFQMFMRPTTPKGTAKVFPGKGIKINHLYYWSDVFRDPEIEGRQVPVRYDPYDISIAYAYVRHQWVDCLCEHYSYFQGHSERELLLATAELRKRRQIHSKLFTITARRLADFLISVEAEEALLPQRLRDAEAKSVLRFMEGGPAKPKGSASSSGRDVHRKTGVENRTSLAEAVKPASPGRRIFQSYEEY